MTRPKIIPNALAVVLANHPDIVGGMLCVFVIGLIIGAQL